MSTIGIDMAHRHGRAIMAPKHPRCFRQGAESKRLSQFSLSGYGPNKCPDFGIESANDTVVMKAISCVTGNSNAFKQFGITPHPRAKQKNAINQRLRRKLAKRQQQKQTTPDNKQTTPDNKPAKYPDNISQTAIEKAVKICRENGF